MPRTRSYHSSLELGEVSPDFLRSAAEGFLERACKTALNVILKAGGGLMRRPGSIELAQLNNPSIRFQYRGRGVEEKLVFSNGRLDVYSEAGTLNQTITTDVPWDATQIDDLRFDSDSNKVFVFHQAFMIQELTRSSTGTWTRTDFQFSASVNGKTSQPFYDKFEDIDVTMGLAAYSGSGIAITFSSDVLVAGHVGLRFRYLTACEVEIVSVTDGQTGTVNIIDALYPTLQVSVADSTKFKAGQVVEGSVSGVVGIVSSVGVGTLQILLLEGYDRFEYDSGTPENSDKLVGEEGEALVTATPTTVVTPATTSIWDEQLISAVRGYPGTGVVHKNRLIMSKFQKATDVIIGSSLGNFDDFLVSAEDEGAFNEELGADPNSQILHLVSTEQLVVLTDRGAFYVPEAPEKPLTPTSIEFAPIGPDGAADIPPFVASEGILFIDADAQRLLLIAQTGNVRRQWNVAELSEAFYHMLTSPKKIVVANGLDGRTERYAMVLNEDGTIAVMMYRRGTEVVGASRWVHGAGVFEDLTVSGDKVVTTSLVGDVRTMSRMTFDARVDDEQDYSAALTGRDAEVSDVVQDLAVIGSGTVAAGEVPGFAPAAGLSAGFDFEVDMTPAAQIDVGRGVELIRITMIWVDCLDSGTFEIDGIPYLPFNATDPLGVPGFTKSRVVEAGQLGWSYEATQSIKQPKGTGTALDVRSITMEISR